jgi:hypothetical protein
VDLEGLQHLQSVDGDLTISSNLILSDLSGLYGLSYIRGDASLIDNPEVSEAEATSFFAEIDRIEGDSVYSP